MASAGDRLQIVIGAKDELSSQLRETRKELTQLGRTANAIQRRMEAGEQGLQDEYEQTRRDIQRVTTEHRELSRRQSEVNREFREMTTASRRAGDHMTRSMDRAGREMGITNGKAERLNRSTMTLSSGWGKMVGIVAGATTALVALGGAVRFLSDSVDEARQARKALSQTAAVLRSMGRTDAPEKIEAMIDSLSLASGIDDDAIREMTNVLLTFGNVQGKTFKEANGLALDLSVAFDKDLQSSAVMVGKALNDPMKGLTALSRIGVMFTAEQQEQIKSMMEVNDVAGAQKIIMGELERQVGGSAAAQADMIDKTNVAWGNFKEAIGQVIFDTAGALAGIGDVDPAKGLRKATKWIEQNGPKIQEVLMTIAGSALRVGEFFLVMAASAANAIGGLLKVMQPLFWAMARSGIPVLSDIGKALDGSGDKALKAGAGMQQAANGAATLADKTFTARDRVQQLNDALEKVKNKKIRVELYSTMTDVQSAVEQAMQYALDFENRFAGGPIAAGNTYMVGEIGPELFVPNVGLPQMVGASGPEIRDFHTSGTIIPTQMVGTYVAATTAENARTATNAPSGVQIGELHVHDRFDAQRELQALLARERRIAAERS